MKDLEKDFKDWLSLPLTKTFVELLTTQKERLVNYANNESFQSYHKKQISEQATLAYGKADGISTILGLIESCSEDELETQLLEGESITNYPTIHSLFQQTYNKNE